MTPLDLITWATSNPELAATLLAAILGGLEAARHYHRTGDLPLRTIPWRAIRRLGYQLRQRWFTTPMPNPDDCAVVPATQTELEGTLGAASYELEWPFSYHYQGEDVNARRYYYDPGREYPHRQLHVRAWTDTTDTPGSTAVIHAHDEPSALHHPHAHLRGTTKVTATHWIADRLTNDATLNPTHFPTESIDSRGFITP